MTLAFQNTLTPHVIVFLHLQGAVYGKGSSVINVISMQYDVVQANFRRLPGEPTRIEVAGRIFAELCEQRYIVRKHEGKDCLWVITRRGLRAVKTSERKERAAAKAREKLARQVALYEQKHYRRKRELSPVD